MGKLRVLCIIGTRPEAVKLAPVIKALRARPEDFEAVVCVTAQHREILDQALDLFGIVPDIDLDLMEPDQDLVGLSARVLEGVSHLLRREQPDWLLVQGDTTTVMAASLAAFYQRIRVGHVEAGLRTHSKSMPFPEEINRRITDAICDLHFVPTARARDNLRREGVSERSIRVTGNTVVDALQTVVDLPLPNADDPLRRVRRDRRLILVTVHRRELYGDPVRRICQSLRRVAERYSEDVEIVIPVHPNPNIRGPVHELLSDTENVVLLPPLPYGSFVELMRRAHLVLTDSGGVQEEAPSLGKPVLVLREVTERPEAVEAGAARLVGTDPTSVEAAVGHLLDDPVAYRSMAQARELFGDGQAARRIAEALLAYTTGEGGTG